MEELTKTLIQMVQTGGALGLWALVIVKGMALLTNILWAIVIIGGIKTIAKMFQFEAK